MDGEGEWRAVSLQEGPWNARHCSHSSAHQLSAFTKRNQRHAETLNRTHGRGRTTSTSSVLTTSEVTFFQETDFQPATVAERLKEQRGTITRPHVPAHFPKLRQIRGRSLHSFVPFWLGDSLTSALQS